MGAVGDKRRQTSGAKGAPPAKAARTGTLTECIEKLRRKGKPADPQPQSRVCFHWAAGEWYLGTILSQSQTKSWWNVEWDDGTKNQIRLADQNRTNWWVLTTDEEDTQLRALIEEYEDSDDIESQDEDDEEEDDDDESEDEGSKKVATARNPKRAVASSRGAGAKGSSFAASKDPALKAEVKQELSKKGLPMAPLRMEGSMLFDGKGGKDVNLHGKAAEPMRAVPKKATEPVPKTAPEQPQPKKVPDQQIPKKAPEQPVPKKVPEQPIPNKAPEQPLLSKADKQHKPHAFAAGGAGSPNLNAPASPPSPELSPREDKRFRKKGEPVSLPELADEVSSLRESVSQIRKEVRSVQRMLEKSERGLLTKLTICADLLRDNRGTDKNSAGPS